MDQYRDDVMGFINSVVSEKKEFFVYDTETTGLSPVDDDIIEFSALKCAYNEKTNKFSVLDEMDVYINVGYKLPEKIVEITGITDQELAENGITPANAAMQINKFLGQNPIMVGYNSVSFDTGFVMKLFRTQMGIDFKYEKQLDVLTMAREKTPKPHKLVDMAEKAGLTDLRFHRSIDDCKATLGVLIYLMPMYKQKEPETNVTGTEILGIRRWTKSHTLDRIYVSNSSNLSIYLDVYTKNWFIDANCDVDMIKNKVYAFAGVSSDKELLDKYPAA